jgi:hypothetical protein
LRHVHQQRLNNPIENVGAVVEVGNHSPACLLVNGPNTPLDMLKEPTVSKELELLANLVARMPIFGM